MKDEEKTVFSITSSNNEDFYSIFDLEGLTANDLHVVHSLLQLSCTEIQKIIAETSLEIDEEDDEDFLNEDPDDNSDEE